MSSTSTINQIEQVVFYVDGTPQSGKTTLLDKICEKPRLKTRTNLLDDNDDKNALNAIGDLSALAIEDLMFNICSFLPACDLVQFSTVSTGLHRLCRLNQLWQHLIYVYFRVNTSDNATVQYVNEQYGGSWFEYFKFKFSIPKFRSLEHMCFVKPKVNQWLTELEKWHELQNAMCLGHYGLIVLDATKDEFIRSQLITMYTVGVTRLVIVLNKIDLIPEEERATRLQSLKQIVLPYAKRIGFRDNLVNVEAVSTAAGFEHTLVPLIETLRSRTSTSVRSTNHKLRGSVYEKMGSFSVEIGNKLVRASAVIVSTPSGKLTAKESYMLTDPKTGTTQKVTCLNISNNLESIELLDSDQSLVSSDMSKVVQILLHDAENPTKHLTISPGSVLHNSDDRIEPAHTLRAQLIALFGPMNPSQKYTVHSHSSYGTATLTTIESLIDKRTGQVMQSNSKSLPIVQIPTGGGAIVIFTFDSPMYCERFSEFSQLGRLTVTPAAVDENDKYDLCGVAIIKDKNM